MGQLIYLMTASLDGYVEDERGKFGWAEPTPEVHRYANQVAAPIGTHLYGRRMYETMRFWDTPEAVEGQPEEMREWAFQWRDADKVVYSRTLEETTTGRTRLLREFDPAEVARLKQESAQDLSVSGPNLAGEVLRHGLLDAIHLIACPIIIGGGKRWLPEGIRVPLQLVDERRFEDGTVALHYRVQA